MEHAYGKGSTYQKTLQKAGVNASFKQRFSKFVAHANVYRKNNPELFDASALGNDTGQLKDKLAHLTPIRLSPNRKLPGLSPEQKRSISVSKNSEYYTPNDFNRIKRANYGKWYVKPNEFNKKLQPLTNIKV